MYKICVYLEKEHLDVLTHSWRRQVDDRYVMGQVMEKGP